MGGGSLLSDNETEKLNWDPYWMICNANSLWEAAKHLAANMEVQSDSFLFSGKLMSAPLRYHQADRSAVPQAAYLPYRPGKAWIHFRQIHDMDRPWSDAPFRYLLEFRS